MGIQRILNTLDEKTTARDNSRKREGKIQRRTRTQQTYTNGGEKQLHQTPINKQSLDFGFFPLGFFPFEFGLLIKSQFSVISPCLFLDQNSCPSFVSYCFVPLTSLWPQSIPVIVKFLVAGPVTKVSSKSTESIQSFKLLTYRRDRRATSRKQSTRRWSKGQRRPSTSRRIRRTSCQPSRARVEVATVLVLGSCQNNRRTNTPHWYSVESSQSNMLDCTNQKE